MGGWADPCINLSMFAWMSMWTGGRMYGWVGWWMYGYLVCFNSFYSLIFFDYLFLKNF